MNYVLQTKELQIIIVGRLYVYVVDTNNRSKVRKIDQGMSVLRL